MIFGEVDFEGFRERPAVGGSDQVRRFPAENVGGQPGELADRGPGVGFAVDGDLLDAFEEPRMVRDDVLVGEGSGRDERGRRDDQAHGLEVAEPFLMREVFRVSGHDVTPSRARGRRARSARCAGL